MKTNINGLITGRTMNEIETTFTSLLIQSDLAIQSLQGNFRAEFLQDETARKIFTAVNELQSTDFKQLRDKLGTGSCWQVFTKLLTARTQFVPVMFKIYALELVEQWKKRELAKIGQARVYTPELVNRAFEIEHFELFPEKSEDASEKFLADAELAYQGQENPRIVKTGFLSLDKLIGGFEKGELITLGGYSGGGKTTLALNIATNVAKEGRKVLYFSLEMTKTEMHKRLVCSSTGIHNFADMTAEEFNRLIAASKSLEHDLPLEFIDDGDMTVEKIAAICGGQKDTALVIIDHLHILKSDRQFKDQYALLTYLTRKIKVMAADLNIPVLLLSQMNRANAAREIKEPTMSDLRGSGSIEQDSNLVIFVYTAENLLKFQEPKEGTKKHQAWEDALEQAKGKAQISVVKNRRGRIGKFTVLFRKEESLFVDSGRGFDDGF